MYKRDDKSFQKGGTRVGRGEGDPGGGGGHSD